MNFIFKLQHIAAVKIATTLWMQDDIKNLMIKNGFYEFHLVGCFRIVPKIVYDYEAERNVGEKVKKLPLPELMQKKIFAVVKSIHFEIIQWKHLCGYYLPFPFFEKAFNHLSWTSEGTVNEKKIAEVLIKDETFDIIGRYELACIYCLETDITKLWGKLSEIQKEVLLNDYDVRCTSYTPNLVVHWTLCMKNTFDNNIETIECTTWKDAFECAVNEVNIVATEYTYWKLTPEERKSFVLVMAQNVSNLLSRISNHNDKRLLVKVFSLLVPQMCEKQQMEIFETYSYALLNSFLDWPMRNLFLDTVETLWDFLPADKCMMLYQDIIDKASSNVNCYTELFKDFWQQSPSIYKKHVFDNYNSEFLIKLFDLNDLTVIKCILKHASTEEKSKIILCDRGQYICSSLVRRSKWDYLEFFILECIPSPNDISKFEHILENFLSRQNLEMLSLGQCRPSYADEMLKLKRFFKLLKDISKDDKKKEF